MNLNQRVWAVADGVCTAPIADHLLVGDRVGGTLRLLNPTAALIWRCLEARVDARGIARDLADAFDIPVARAGADVEGMLQTWEEAALLQPNPLPSPVPVEPDPPAPAIPGDAVAVRTGCYRLGAKRFEIRYLAAADSDASGRAFIDRIAALLSGVAARGEAGLAPVPAIDFCAGRSWSAVAFRDTRWRGDSTIDGFVELCSIMLHAAYGPFDWLCRLHAAALARDGAAIVLPAPAGNGKSTLAAYLAASGWTYLADDTTTLDPHSRALPLPTAIGLKAGSLPVLDRLYPGLQSLPEHEYADKVARYVALDSQRAAGAPLAVSAMVFPKYRAGREPSLERLSAPQAAARLMQAGMGFGGTLTPAKLEWFAGLVQRTPCWALGYESLPDAEAKLRSIVDGSCAA